MDDSSLFFIIISVSATDNLELHCSKKDGTATILKSGTVAAEFSLGEVQRSAIIFGQFWGRQL